MGEDTLNEAKIRLHEAYLRHRDKLEQGRKENYQSFDRHVITLASGAIGLSVVFLKQLAPNPKPCTTALLWLAWLFFLSTLVLSLLSFIFGKLAHDKELARWDKYHKLWKKYYESHDEKILAEVEELMGDRIRFSTATAVLKYCSLGTFCIGAAFFCLFAGVNV